MKEKYKKKAVSFDEPVYNGLVELCATRKAKGIFPNKQRDVVADLIMQANKRECGK